MRQILPILALILAQTPCRPAEVGWQRPSVVPENPIRDLGDSTVLTPHPDRIAAIVRRQAEHAPGLPRELEELARLRQALPPVNDMVPQAQPAAFRALGRILGDRRHGEILYQALLAQPA